MTSERDVLFAALPTLGHTSALRALGAELRRRGHRTSFAVVHVWFPHLSRWPEPVRAAARLPSAIAAEGWKLLALPAAPVSLWQAARTSSATGEAELEARSLAKRSERETGLEPATFSLGS